METLKNYHLAQINIARMSGESLEDPIMKEFKDNLDRVNELAESSEGFVWRFKDDPEQPSPFDDPKIIINLSVWEDLKTLQAFTFKTFHADFLRRRKEWFSKMTEHHLAMWWIAPGHIPTLIEAKQKLDFMDVNGPSVEAFNFSRIFEMSI